MTSSHAQPNTLGRVLRYWTDAVAYARAPFAPEAKARPRSFETGILRDMAAKDKYSSGGTIDSGEAERMAITSYAYYAAIRTVTARLSADKARPRAGKWNGSTKEEVPDHPFNALLRHPNDTMSYGFIMRYVAGWLMLRGNGYIFISTPRIGSGEPKELWPLPANKVTPLPESVRRSKATGAMTRDYMLTLDGKEHILPGENVLHVMLPNWWDYWEGLSPLTAALPAVKTDRYQADWLQGFFGKDNAIPTALISLPPDTTKTDFETAIEAIKEQFGEGRSSAVIRAGDMDVKVIQQTIKEMEILVGRHFSRSEIYQVLGTPEGLVTGTIDGNDLHATLLTFAVNTIQPLIDEFAALWTLTLHPYYGDDFVAVAPDIVPQDRALAVQEYTQHSLDRTINENRDVLGLPALEMEICETIPVRILRHIAAPGAAEVMEQRVGTLTGSEHPEQMTNRLADDEEDQDTPPDTTDTTGEDKDEEDKKAMNVAIRGEMKRWRKVALTELGKGRRPEERVFSSALIPASVCEEIVVALGEAHSAEDIKSLFATHATTFTEAGNDPAEGEEVE